MKVNAADLTLNLVEAYVVKPFEACPANRPNAVIRYQEMLLPTHEDMFPLWGICDSDRAFPCLLQEGPEGAEFGPVAQVHLCVGPPFVMLGDETIFATNDLAFEVGR